MKNKSAIGCKRSMKRELARIRAAKAISEWLDEDELGLLRVALETAQDDSHEWSKYSDDGDDRREHESEMLGRMLSVANAAQRLAAGKKTNPKKE